MKNRSQKLFASLVKVRRRKQWPLLNRLKPLQNLWVSKTCKISHQFTSQIEHSIRHWRLSMAKKIWTLFCFKEEFSSTKAATRKHPSSSSKLTRNKLIMREKTRTQSAGTSLLAWTSANLNLETRHMSAISTRLHYSTNQRVFPDHQVLKLPSISSTIGIKMWPMPSSHTKFAEAVLNWKMADFK